MTLTSTPAFPDVRSEAAPERALLVFLTQAAALGSVLLFEALPLIGAGR